LRKPGSIGAAFPEHVMKGVKMAGQMGEAKVTKSNMEIVSIDKEKNLLAIRGSIPGARNTLILIKEHK
jgi:large subunit ribosomal protein L3